jgi:hypothetical protein
MLRVIGVFLIAFCHFSYDSTDVQLGSNLRNGEFCDENFKFLDRTWRCEDFEVVPY